ncbi:MAG: hypothetical protein SO041_02425 [Dysosmobacter sp.]|nr:hypothetical protein [Dysosmobacter sp.]
MARRFERLCFDNGPQYRTHWMKRACGLLGIRLIYAKPRNPQGKGKQERVSVYPLEPLGAIALVVVDLHHEG